MKLCNVHIEHILGGEGSIPWRSHVYLNSKDEYKLTRQGRGKNILGRGDRHEKKLWGGMGHEQPTEQKEGKYNWCTENKEQGHRSKSQMG